MVTTDLSPESAAAFPVAAELAQSLGATIHLVAIVEDPAQAALMFATEFPVFPDRGILDQLVERAKDELNQIATKHLSALTVKTHVRVSERSVHAEILAVAKELKADLIVMATHGRTGIAHLVIGSVAERVLRGSTCPVLLVPTAKRGQNP